MSTYVVKNEQGRPSFYREDVHGLRFLEEEEGEKVENPDCLIPANAVLVSEKDLATYYANPNAWGFNDDGKLSPVVVSIADVKAEKEREITWEFRKRMQELNANYTKEERATWPTQKGEALAWLESHINETPTLSAMASQSGELVSSLAQKIIDKVRQYDVSAGAILGTKRLLLEKVKTIDETTPDAVLVVESIVWPED